MKTKQDFLFQIVVIMMCLVQSFCSAATNPLKPTGTLTNRTVTIEFAVVDVLRSLAIEKEDPVLNKVDKWGQPQFNFNNKFRLFKVVNDNSAWHNYHIYKIKGIFRQRSFHRLMIF